MSMQAHYFGCPALKGGTCTCAAIDQAVEHGALAKPPPKNSSAIDQMRETIAKMLGVPLDQVQVHQGEEARRIMEGAKRPHVKAATNTPNTDLVPIVSEIKDMHPLLSLIFQCIEPFIGGGYRLAFKPLARDGEGQIIAMDVYLKHAHYAAQSGWPKLHLDMRDMKEIGDAWKDVD